MGVGSKTYIKDVLSSNGASINSERPSTQGELQKSCETGAELHNLTGIMNDIHDTLGGSPAVYSVTISLLTSRLSTGSKSRDILTGIAIVDIGNHTRPSGPPNAAPRDPTSLASDIDKVCALEHLFAEHDTIKHEVNMVGSGSKRNTAMMREIPCFSGKDSGSGRRWRNLGLLMRDQ